MQYLLGADATAMQPYTGF